ncbi:MAG TPA: hypothetical protein IGS17_20900 [Oscillatoriales cyanobacterium M59_W2019_021]|nr:hypothetical protein [Oscillatoriales cyanobacterium M4454_W2019_049]HIK53349.1 hypothetical protein [Oscillatoriales cyanobacterium M59_W2019_021]
MFVSNQLSKFLVPTAIALVFTSLAQWLTTETDRLSARHEIEFASGVAPTPSPTFSSPPGTRSRHPNNRATAATSSNRSSNWIADWQNRSTRWRQHIAGFWSDGKDRQPKTGTISSQPSPTPSLLTRTISDRHDAQSEAMSRLFSTPDSPGSIAIGAAEGTRTQIGGITPLYWGHRDPANGVTNLGTFSYQHGARDARQADSLQLERLKQQVAEIRRQAAEAGVKLSPLELVAAADLANQSPEAGYAYIDNLQQAYDRGFRGIEALLEARMQSFVDPETQNLDAVGFGNNWQKLRQDQLRRLSKLQKTLKAHGEI